MQNKRIVVKVGTSTLSHPSGLLNIRRVEELCKVLSDLKNAGNEIILVSSGAIGMGVGKLSLPKRPEDMPTKQAAAAEKNAALLSEALGNSRAASPESPVGQTKAAKKIAESKMQPSMPARNEGMHR